MERRSLGSTGITVPVIGFGCGGNAELMVGEDEALRIATIRAALDAGIDYFDTAAAYGWGRSEVNLGRALTELGASPTISDKVVLQRDDLGDARSAVLRHFDEGMARLGRDHVDALMLHNRVFLEVEPGATHAVGAQLSLRDMFGPNGVVAAFEELVAARRVTTVGFTAFGGDPRAIAEMIDSKAFGAINASYNLLNPSAAIAVPPGFAEDYAAVIGRASAAGLGVMAIQVLARGVLTGAGPTEGRPAQVAATAAAFDESLAGAATRYVLANRDVSVAILGLSRPEHVAAAVAAAGRGPLPPEALAAIERVSLGSPQVST